MTTTNNSHTPLAKQGVRLALIAAAGGLVSLSLGVYGRVHEPTGRRVTTLFFSSLVAMKAWLATVSFTLALLQLFSALAMYGRLPSVGSTTRWLPFVHRWSGTTAFLVSLPVGYHCLWALGVQTTGTRQIAHSVMGCLFYGAFASKLLCLHSNGLPKWRLPVVGGVLVALLTGIWLTSALWFFTNVA